MFVPEKMKYESIESDSDEEEEDEELTIKPNQIFGITKDIMRNPNFLCFIVFLMLTFAANSIENNIATVYMTNDVSDEEIYFFELYPDINFKL